MEMPFEIEITDVGIHDIMKTFQHPEFVKDAGNAAAGCSNRLLAASPAHQDLPGRLPQPPDKLSAGGIPILRGRHRRIPQAGSDMLGTHPENQPVLPLMVAVPDQYNDPPQGITPFHIPFVLDHLQQVQELPFLFTGIKIQFRDIPAVNEHEIVVAAVEGDGHLFEIVHHVDLQAETIPAPSALLLPMLSLSPGLRLKR